MSYTGKDIGNAILSGISAGMMFSAAIISATLQKGYQRGKQAGVEKGRAEATSNLVSAVNALSERSRNNLFLRVNGVVNSETLSLKEKESYLNSSHDIVCQIESIRGDLSKNAERYAAGEKPSTNQTFQTPALNIKIGEFY